MGGRYVLSGVQLGMMTSLVRQGKKQAVFDQIEHIKEKQFIGHSSENLEDDAKELSKHMKPAPWEEKKDV